MLKILIFSLFINTFLIVQAKSYFDPGTGAFIIQSILAFFAAIAFYLGYPIRIIKNFINKLKKKNKNKDDKEI